MKLELNYPGENSTGKQRRPVLTRLLQPFARRLCLAIVLLPAIGNLSFAQDTAKPPKWQRSGFIVSWQRDTTDKPIIDVKRAIGLRQQSCGSHAGIKFGDNALMRDAAKLSSWPEPVKRLSAAAELTDNQVHAFELLDAALKDKALGNEQRFFLNNQKMSLALRYRDSALFHKLQQEPRDDVPDALVADRIFLKAYALTWTAASRADWQAIDALLDQAVAHDGKYYNVVAWRVLAWLKINSYGAGKNQDCSSKVKQFSDRLMSASQASPCPMMLGHFSHFLDKQFKARSAGSVQDEGRSLPSNLAWRSFGDGVLGFISGNDAVTGHSYKTLAGAATSTSSKPACSRELAVALNQLLESR